MTLKEKNKAGAVLKCLGYLIGAYLLASWGVNGVVNPVHYFRNMDMKIQELELSECAEGMEILLPQDSRWDGSGFLSFLAAESEDHSFRLRLVGYDAQGAGREINMKAWKGWNSLDLAEAAGPGNQWVKIIVPGDALASEGLVFGGAGISEYRKVSTGRTAYIWAAFLFMAAFWECVWWIKERYGE